MARGVYTQTEFPQDTAYKLVQLPNEILEYVTGNKGDLELKAPDQTPGGGLVLCTKDSTYKVRQMNHLNTVLLCNDMSTNGLGMELKGGQSHQQDDLVAVASLNYEYELSKSVGHINTTDIPIYDGLNENKTVNGLSLEEIIQRSPISRTEFVHLWRATGGCEIDGNAVILAKPLITDTLYSILTVMAAEGIDYRAKVDKNALVTLMEEKDPLQKLEVVSAVLDKFIEDSLELNHESIGTWFGIQALSKNEGTTSKESFLLGWKSSLPSFYNVPIGVEQLRGYYYCTGAGQIRYFDRLMLMGRDLATRMKEIFSLAKQWDWEDLLPYINEVVPVGKKPESVILKFAKLKRVGKNRVVVPR